MKSADRLLTIGVTALICGLFVWILPTRHEPDVGGRGSAAPSRSNHGHGGPPAETNPPVNDEGVENSTANVARAPSANRPHIRPPSDHLLQRLAAVELLARSGDVVAYRVALKDLMDARRSLLASADCRTRLLALLDDGNVPLAGTGRTWLELLQIGPESEIAVVALRRIELFVATISGDASAASIEDGVRADDIEALVELLVAVAPTRAGERDVRMLEYLRLFKKSSATLMIGALLGTIKGDGAPELLTELQLLVRNGPCGELAFAALCRVRGERAKRAAWEAFTADASRQKTRARALGAALDRDSAQSLRAWTERTGRRGIYFRALLKTPAETLAGEREFVLAATSDALEKGPESALFESALVLVATRAPEFGDAALLDSLERLATDPRLNRRYAKIVRYARSSLHRELDSQDAD